MRSNAVFLAVFFPGNLCNNLLRKKKYENFRYELVRNEIANFTKDILLVLFYFIFVNSKVLSLPSPTINLGFSKLVLRARAF